MHFCARFHNHRQMLCLITCSDHRTLLTHHITSGPGERRRSRCSGRVRRYTSDKTSLKIAARANTFSELALLFTWAGRPGGAVSDEVGVMSTQLAQRQPPDTTLPNVVDS